MIGMNVARREGVLLSGARGSSTLLLTKIVVTAQLLRCVVWMTVNLTRLVVHKASAGKAPTAIDNYQIANSILEL